MISKQKGNTMLDVLVALSMMAFGVIGIFRLQVYMEQKADYAYRSTHALHIAESRLERLSAELYGYDGSVDDLNAEELLEGEYQLMVLVAELSVAKLPGAINGKALSFYVSVEVSWKDSKSQPKNVKLSTVMTNT